MRQRLWQRALKWIAVGVPVVLVLGIVWNTVHESPEAAIERLGGKVVTTFQGPQWVPAILNYVPSGARLLDKISLVESVDVGGTEFGDADALQLVSLDGVRTLSLGGTRITDAGLESIAQLRDLRSLSVEGTAVTDAGLAHLRHCSRLSQLNLASTRVTGAGLPHIGALAELRFVSLAGTQVSGPGFAHVAALRNLQFLDLSNTPIADGDLEYLRGLTAITLILRDTQITESGLSWLNRANGIVGLDLAGTHVTDGVFRHFLTYPQLGRVNVQNTRVTQSGIDEFFKQTTLIDVQRE